LHVISDMFSSSFLGRKWVQKGTHNVTKNHEKSIPAPGCNFGAIWGRFFTDVGPILGRLLIDFGPIWDRFSIDFDTIFSTHFSPRKTAANSTNLPEITGTAENSRKW